MKEIQPQQIWNEEKMEGVKKLIQKQKLIDMMEQDEKLGLYEETKCYCGHTTTCDCGPELDCKDCSQSLQDCTCIEDTIDMKQSTKDRILSETSEEIKQRVRDTANKLVMKDFFKDRPKLNLWDKISLWWKFDGKYYHKFLKQGIKNIIYWFPIIWKDRNWDHDYIFRLLQHKLKAQSKYIGSHNRHTRAQYDAQRMNLCINLIQKLQDSYYDLEYMDYAKDRYWFEPCEGKEGYSTWESENIWEEYDQYFKKYLNIYRKVMNGEGFAPIKGREDDKHFIAMSIGHMNVERAHKLLFKVLQTNIRNWWD